MPSSTALPCRAVLSRWSVAALVVALALLAMAAPRADAAYTSTVGAPGPTLTGDGSSDTLTIDTSGGLLTHNRFPTDPGFNSQFDFDSTTAGDQTVAATDAVTVNAGGGDDAVNVRVPTVTGSTVHGDDGDDVVITSNGVDSLFGDAGNDRLVGGVGNDGMTGGTGNDVMVWNNGDNNDTMNGEAGNDEVEVNGSTNLGDTFTIAPNGDRVRFDRTNLVPFFLDIGTSERMTVNGLGGGDSITGAAGLAPLILLSLHGGNGVDTITGGDGPDFITGGDGNDNLAGAGGDDRVVGDRGDDTMAGGDGDDTLVWNNGDNNDKMDGDAGLDRTEVNGAVVAGDTFVIAPNGQRAKFDRTNLVPFTLDIAVEGIVVGGHGGDDVITVAQGAAALLGINLDGGSGNDRIEVRDGAPAFVRCGDGNDTVIADEIQVDIVLADCEAVDRTPTQVTDVTGTPLRILTRSSRVSGTLRRGRAPIRVECPAAETGGCAGTLTLTSASRVRLGRVRIVVVLGATRFNLTPGQRRTLRVRLPSTMRAIARGRRTFRARASAVSRDAAGNLGTSSRRVTLRLPRR